MKLEDIRIIKKDDRGVLYDCGKSSFISRKKGSISADHTHEDPEIIYLVKGKVELTIEDETKVVEAPVRFEIPENIYHRLIALTDIEIVIDREGDR